MRRWYAPLLIAIGAAAIAGPAVDSQVNRPQLIGFDVVEASISDMQRAMETNRVSSKELVLQSLARIAIYKDLLNPTVALNGRAVEEAEHFHGEGEDEGGVLLGGDLDDGLQQSQLQGGRVGGHDGGGLGELLGCLVFAVGGDDPGAAFPLGFGLP